MDGYEMKHIASRSIEEVSYCFSTSSVKVQDLIGRKINLDIVLDYKAGRTYQIPLIRLVIRSDKNYTNKYCIYMNSVLCPLLFNIFI